MTAISMAILLTALFGSRDVDPLDDLEIRALAIVDEAHRVVREGGDRIWPGFTLETIPIAIFRARGDALLIGHPAPPPDYHRIRAGDSRPVFRGPRTPGMNANTSGVLNEVVCAFVDLASLGSGSISVDPVALVIHEAGHAFRDRAPAGGHPRWPAEDSSLTPRYPQESPSNNAWGRIEGALLADALAAEALSDLRDLAVDLLVVRRHRQEALDADLRTYEAHVELNEGLAEYFAVRAVTLGESPSDDGAGNGWRAEGYGVAGSYLRDLRGNLRRLNAAGAGANRRRFYSSGAALGLLLDRLAPGWKWRVEEGGTLQGILADTLDQPEWAARRSRIAEARDYERLLAEEQSAADAIAAVRRRKLVDVLTAPGLKLVLDLTDAGGVGQMLRFDPMNMVVVDPQHRVHTRMLRLGFHGGEARFERAVAQDFPRSLAITTLPVQAETHLADSPGPVKIRAPGLELNCDAAAWLRTEEFLLIRPHAGGPVDPAPYHAYFAAARKESRAPAAAPPFHGVDLGGTTHRHPEAKTRATALVFFSAAPWAKPARRFVRELLDALEHRPVQRDDLRLLWIAAQCDESEIRALVGDPSVPGFILDADRSWARRFGVETYPTVIWIDRNGFMEPPRCGATAEHLAEVVGRLLRP